MDPAEIRAELVRHHPDAFSWALHCARFDRTEAEDVLQVAYLKILEGRARFEGRSAFRTWLFGVIRRTAGERRRWRAARALLFNRWQTRSATPEAGEADTLSELALLDDARSLAVALNRLPARQRDMLYLVFYEEISIAEAANTLGLKIGTARTHYKRGKERLRRLLEEEGT